MGVASYGLTACSMEEIFVQLTHKEAAEAPDGRTLQILPFCHKPLSTSGPQLIAHVISLIRTCVNYLRYTIDSWHSEVLVQLTVKEARDMVGP